MSAEPARSNPFAVPLATVFVVLVQTCSRPSGVCFLMVTWCCLSPGWVSWPLCSRTFSRNLRCVTSEYPCCREREYRHFRAVTRKGNRKHKSNFSLQVPCMPAARRIFASRGRNWSPDQAQIPPRFPAVQDWGSWDGAQRHQRKCSDCCRARAQKEARRPHGC